MDTDAKSEDPSIIQASIASSKDERSGYMLGIPALTGKENRPPSAVRAEKRLSFSGAHRLHAIYDTFSQDSSLHPDTWSPTLYEEPHRQS
jgi:hypothetical protein